MTKVLQLGQQQIPLEQLPFLLDKYDLLPILAEEIIIDQAIAPIDLTPEETASRYNRRKEVTESENPEV